jgi:tRNA A22 N-methylase
VFVTVICGLFGCATIFHIISQKTQISEKKDIENEMNAVLFPTNFSEEFREKLSLMYIGLHVK